MRTALILAILLVLGAMAFGLRTRQGDKPMDEMEEKARRAEDLVRRAKEKIETLGKERRAIIARYIEELTRIKREKISKEIADL